MESQFDPVPFIMETRFNAVSAVLVIDRLMLAAPDDLSASSSSERGRIAPRT